MKWNKKKVIQHSVFWLVYTIFWHFVWSPNWASLASIVVSLIYTASNIFAAYTCIYWLVPKFLNKREHVLFFLSCIILLFVTAVMNAGVLLGFLYLYDPTAPAEFLDQPMAYGSFLGSNSSAILFALAIHEYFKRKEAEKRKEEIQKENLETELKYLKNQLNPHFLFNALNSIYFLIKKDPDLAAEQLAGFSDLLRHQLYQSADEKITLRQELENLEKFTLLEKLRMPTDLQLDFNLPKNINGEMIAPFLLQPMVENAFKYVKRKKGEVEVDAMLKENNFHFLVKNNIEREKLPPGRIGGIGLTNLRRRLELLYPQQHELNVEEKENEFIADLKITLTK